VTKQDDPVWMVSFPLKIKEKRKKNVIQHTNDELRLMYQTLVTKNRKDRGAYAKMKIQH